MSGASSNAAAWNTLIEPVGPYPSARGSEDPRLGDVTEFWRGGEATLRPGRVALVGFPQDEGVRRNGGRVGAAEAPAAIRQQLYRLTPWDPPSQLDLQLCPPIDLGDVRCGVDLEATQQALGQVVSHLLRLGLVPVVLGGGHETAFGTFLGYVGAERPLSIINLDAHLDVRPLAQGQGHSGSPFRQALEHPAGLLRRYTCVGAQPFSNSREHTRFVEEKGGSIVWAYVATRWLFETFLAELLKDDSSNGSFHLSLDVDVVSAAVVPGVSAPNPHGLDGQAILNGLFSAGRAKRVTSFELVELNPRFDRDSQSARWAALAIWTFLVGRAQLSMPCQ
jgi:formiminoglutamase